MRGQTSEKQCQGFAVGLSVPARIAQLTPGDPCWTVFFFLSGAKPHKDKQPKNNPKPTNTRTNANHNNETQAGRPWASRPPPLTREAALDQLAQRQSSSKRAKPTEAPKTQPNDDEQQNPTNPNPKPRQTNPKPRTNTPHSPQITEALYAGANFRSAMPRIRRWTFSPSQDSELV